MGDADLQRAWLSGAKLQGASLGEANLQGAELREAHIGGADFEGARLDLADLRKLIGTPLSETQYQELIKALEEEIDNAKLRASVLLRLKSIIGKAGLWPF